MAERPTRFAILSARRCGSNLLCSLLDSHPDVRCHHELFNPAGPFTALDLRDAPSPLHDRAARDRDPLAFLQRVWASAPAHRCVGFKMTPDQAPDVLDAVLADRGVRKLVLRRDNPLRALVSERIAESTGCWERYAGEPAPATRPRVRVTREALQRHVAEVDAFYARVLAPLRADGQTWLELRYETLFDAEAQRLLLAFLGVAPLPLRTRSVHQNPEPLSQLLDDADALRRALAGTALAGCLD